MGWATLSAQANRVAFNRLGSVSVVADAVTGRGFLRTPGDYIQNDRVISNEYVLQVETADFGNLAYNDSINVGGESYIVREAPLMVDDGTFCLVLLSKGVTNLVLLEDGASLLLEDGGFLILDT